MSILRQSANSDMGRKPSIPHRWRSWEEALEQLLETSPARYPSVVMDRELIEGSPTAFLTGATTYADLIVESGVSQEARCSARSLIPCSIFRSMTRLPGSMRYKDNALVTG